MKRLTAPVVIGLAAAAAYLLAGAGFVNYDTQYTLLWGADLWHGVAPDLERAVAPTPHPLATLVGLALAPLGVSATLAIATFVAFIFLGTLAWVVFALGSEWGGAAVGVLAAVIVLTREPVLSFGARSYVDLPYLVLVLSALLIETRRRRAGLPVLALLAVAGLLRPEAWLFSAVYVAWLWREERARELLPLAALAAAAPVVWLLSDLALTGDALHSLSGTRENVETLGRATGLGALPEAIPRKLGEVLREPGLLGMALGGGLLWIRRREAARLPFAAIALALGAFGILAIAGLPIITRYLLLAGSLGAILCAIAIVGWADEPSGQPWRGRWMTASAAVVAAFVVLGPIHVDRLGEMRDSLRAQERAGDDLAALVPAIEARPACEPVTLPNSRGIPLLALRLRDPERTLVAGSLPRPTGGLLVTPRNPKRPPDFRLDVRDPGRFAHKDAGRGFETVATNRTWRLSARC